MNQVRRTLIVVVVGIIAILVDRFGGHPPAPPSWLLAWAGWIATGWAISFGPRLISALLHAEPKPRGAPASGSI